MEQESGRVKYAFEFMNRAEPTSYKTRIFCRLLSSCEQDFNFKKACKRQENAQSISYHTV